jgi:MFS family permease
VSDAPARVGWKEVLTPEYLPPLAVLLGGVLVHAMNVMLVATVLPSIVADVGGANLLAWPMTSFMAASIIAATSSGLIAQRVGARGGYVIGALVFAVGSLACAIAPGMIEVVAGRFVQGFGGGILAGLAYVLVRKTFPQRVWARVFALLSGVWSVAVILGPLLGGVFANLGNWRAAFITTALIALGLGVVTLFALPKVSRDVTSAMRGFPAGRLALVCLAIAVLSAAALGDGMAQKTGLLIAALAVFALMLRLDRRSVSPLLPTDAFSLTSVTGTSIAIALLMSVVFTQMASFLPLFLQRVHGAEPLTAGYMVALSSLSWTAVAVSVSGLNEPWPSRLIVLGPVFTFFGLCGMAWLVPVGPLFAIVPAIMFMGLAMGSSWAFLIHRTMSGAKEGEEDLAASSVAMVQQGGLAIGAAWAGVVANAAGMDGGDTTEAATAAAFWVPAASLPVAVLAIFLAVRLYHLAAMRKVGFPTDG